ncbi:DNA (cytosine-5-)-methyltransferase [Methylovulum psychrotolerans]|uniref:DNA (cytosine-5-)-methyltransferase n=1 Tax=Methylovulum psychrotolerans TaxID=1704499 RepID=UPI001BFEFE7A|nr:DNA (cytosine-5-)-methyltransferase [Methylovulum psychrotolerans]MBT9097499.1 DNA (cytosine-5-)-methyltransferase [Methylovulum psychrotolerans]
MLKFVDLFAGIGGIRKGLEMALDEFAIKHQCVFSSEINLKAQETYQLNYEETPQGDIRLIDSLPEHDILLAGFPCQSFSYAGKQQGFADTRGTLFFEIERLLNAATSKPRLMLLENVRGFTTHDKGRTFATVVKKLEDLGYGVTTCLLNSSNFGVPQNRVRIYLVCSLGHTPHLSIKSDLGAADSHKFKQAILQGDLFSTEVPHRCVADILEPKVDEKYVCSPKFISQLSEAITPNGFDSLHGVRLIDHRGGNSIHSWDMGKNGHCSSTEKRLMDAIISNRRKKHFGADKDGKKLTLEQIQSFWDQPDLENTLASLVSKGYLKQEDDKYNPICGNMSFEVFKFLDPSSISITVVSSDANRLGVVQDGIPRRITPRECARLQGFPDDFILHPNDTFAYHQLGNSVSVPVISALFRDLVVNGEQPFPPVMENKARPPKHQNSGQKANAQKWVGALAASPCPTN